MNERIRLLAEQAGFAYEPSETLQKFAELIVQECISMADKESERYSNLDQEYCSMAMDNYRELVRKHFGVEE
jgi:Na+-transporting NADH:ubiquinone oxidoreductase subunit NqrD